MEARKEFQHLESIVTSICIYTDKEVNSCIKKASKWFTSLSRVLWYQRKIKLKNMYKLRVFKAMTLPTLLHCSEAWALTAIHLRRLKSFVMRCLRVILGISVRDRMYNNQGRRNRSGWFSSNWTNIRLRRYLKISFWSDSFPSRR